MEKVVVLCSGGLNSAATVAIARHECEVALLHVKIGQRVDGAKLAAFEQLARHYDTPERLVLSMPHFAAIGGSARVDPSLEFESADDVHRLPCASYLPGLVSSLLSAAFGWASRIGATQVWIGISDNLGPPPPRTSALYPDFGRDYVLAMQHAFEIASPQRSIKLETPLIDLKRGDIIRLGQRLEVPFKLTWSCIADADAPCRRCIPCATRMRGFIDAGMADPLLPVSSQAAAI